MCSRSNVILSERKPMSLYQIANETLLIPLDLLFTNNWTVIERIYECSITSLLRISGIKWGNVKLNCFVHAFIHFRQYNIIIDLFLISQHMLVEYCVKYLKLVKVNFIFKLPLSSQRKTRYENTLQVHTNNTTSKRSIKFVLLMGSDIPTLVQLNSSIKMKFTGGINLPGKFRSMNPSSVLKQRFRDDFRTSHSDGAGRDQPLSTFLDAAVLL